MSSACHIGKNKKLLFWLAKLFRVEPNGLREKIPVLAQIWMSVNLLVIPLTLDGLANGIQSRDIGICISDGVKETLKLCVVMIGILWYNLHRRSHRCECCQTWQHIAHSEWPCHLPCHQTDMLKVNNIQNVYWSLSWKVLFSIVIRHQWCIDSTSRNAPP